MNLDGADRSISWRVVAVVLLGEFVFALALGFTVGAFMLLSATRQQEQARERIAGTIAASMMPLIADQQQTRIDDGLDSIISAASLDDVACIHIVDSSGQTVAAHGDSGACLPDTTPQSNSPWAIFTESRLVEQSIVVDGMNVAVAYIRFQPLDIGEALGTPLLAFGLVLVSVMFISVPWTAWVVVRDVAQPIQEIDEYAARIATGEYDIVIEHEAHGEIAQLQQTLGRMASQLKEQRSRLQDSYDELTEAYTSLEVAKAQVEELATMKADFVAVAAHEIRTPLSTILLYTERLEAGQVTELDEAGLEAVAAIHSAASRLGTIAVDLTDSSLLERGLLPLQFGDVWFDEVVEDAVRDAAPAAAVRYQRLHLCDEIPEMIVRGDQLRLRQVIDNLLSNAMKYSPRDTEIIVRAEEDDESVAVHVIDHGCGVAVKDGDRLFKLFGRLDVGESRNTAGLGLGLAISARIVEAHAGSLTFRPNEAGRGTVFTVRLPKNGPAEEPSSYARITMDGGWKES